MVGPLYDVHNHMYLLPSTILGFVYMMCVNACLKPKLSSELCLIINDMGMNIVLDNLMFTTCHLAI